MNLAMFSRAIQQQPVACSGLFSDRCLVAPVVKKS